MEMTRSAMREPYESEHSYGLTYGDHRAALELSYDEIASCARHAHRLGLEFVLTVCAPTCVRSTLNRFEPDAWKIASRDLRNIPLLRAVARTQIPTIISTGMASASDINDAVHVFENERGNLHAILHCLSEYPARYERLNLRTVQWLAKRYDCHVGYSDHSIGIAMAPVAVALGAQIIEKHITLSRAEKGSDHAGSLEPDGLHRMVRDIRNTDRALGQVAIYADDEIQKIRHKLERSIASARPIKPGELVDESNTCMLSPGTGYAWSERDQVFGMYAARDIESKELITSADLRSDAITLRRQSRKG